jgi:hypothetical protein
MMLEFGIDLIQRRMPEIGRHPLLFGTLVLVLLWMVLEPFVDTDPARVTHPVGRWQENAARFLPCACFAFLYGFAGENWAAFALGQAVGWFFWAAGKLWQRSYFVAVVGFALAGIVAFALPWPNEQRKELVFVLGGFAVSLQGLRDLITELRGPQCIGT